LTPGPQSFANALEDRGFILARVTPADIQKEMERLRAEWEERRRNPQTWMEHESGFKALSPELQDSARRSFDAWGEKQEQRNHQEQDGKKPALLPSFPPMTSRKGLRVTLNTSKENGRKARNPNWNARQASLPLSPLLAAFTPSPRATPDSSAMNSPHISKALTAPRY
jgi:hypothetical protein